MKNSGDKIIRQQVDNVQVRFDKEAAWMKLQDRLESKDEQKGYSRVGWVAAGVLLLASVLWYSLQDDVQQPVVNVMHKATEPLKVEPVKEDVSPIAKEQKNITVIPQKKKVQIATPGKESIPKIQKTIPEPVIVQQEIAPLSEVPKIVSAPKPKMKVVHINEVMQDKERTRIMREIYVIEEQLQKDQRTYELQEDRNTSRPQNPFQTNHIIQN